MACQIWRFACLALAAVWFLGLPQSFVPAPLRAGQTVWLHAVMAGGATSVVTHPAWAYVCGGKNCKANNMVVVAPAEDGVSDKQIAVLFVIALVGFFAALDVIKKLADGVNPSNPRRKGNITPLVKRIIENGY
mmetsp:Transcript_59078/g.113961  ORF Transcript_59078/g.113961 Transcript_59078/m.113961 type:complete len:133 (-) Transcript_59078:62-460(-)